MYKVGDILINKEKKYKVVVKNISPVAQMLHVELTEEYIRSDRTVTFPKGYPFTIYFSDSDFELYKKLHTKSNKPAWF